jgi:hypothetical protein
MWQSLKIMFLSCLSNVIQKKTLLQDFHQDLKSIFFFIFVTVIHEEIISKKAFLYLSGALLSPFFSTNYHLFFFSSVIKKFKVIVLCSLVVLEDC